MTIRRVLERCRTARVPLAAALLATGLGLGPAGPAAAQAPGEAPDPSVEGALRPGGVPGEPRGVPPEVLEHVRRLAAELAPVPVFGEAIEVRVVEVEVVVTDRGGERVFGLGREDFRLMVGGREVAIDAFDERRDGLPVPPAPGAAGDRVASAAPDGDVGDGAGLDGSRPQGVRYLVFLDDFFTDRRYRGAVLDRAIDQLALLRPRDRMAVVRFRGRGVEVLSDWTASKPDLARVLEEARKAPTWELRRDARLASATNPANQVRIQARQIEDAQKTLTAAMRAFSRVPERKVLLLFSSGWPYDLPHSDSDLGARFQAHNLGGRRLLQPVTDTANLLGFTIYTFHLGGLGARMPTAADRFPSSSGIARREPLGSLQHFADQTGGRMFAYAAVSARPFAEVLEDTANYYSLGFRAPMMGDGGLRPITVQVLGDGLRVRHRHGYRDLTRVQRADLAAEEALFAGGSGNAPLDVTLGEFRGLRTGKMPFSVRIPMEWVTMLPAGEDRVTSRLELRIAALDAGGDRSEMTTIPIEISGPRPEPGNDSVYEAEIELRRRKQRVVFTLTDLLGGETLATTIDLDP